MEPTGPNVPLEQTMPASTPSWKRYLLPAIAILLLIGIAVAAWFVWFAGGGANKEVEDIQASFNSNNLDDALAKTDAALAKNAGNASLLTLKALTLAQKGSLSFKEQEFGAQAVTVAEEAIKADPKSSEAYRVLGYAYEIQQQYDKAHENYQKAIQLDAHNVVAVFGDAHAYDLQGNLEKAESGYRAALAINPNYDQAHAGLGRILVAKNDVKGAIAEYKLAVDFATNAHTKAESAYSLANLYLQQNDVASARVRADEATTLDANYPLGWYVLGKTKIAQASIDDTKATPQERLTLVQEATQHFIKALKLNPNQSVVYFDFASIEHTLYKNDEMARALIKGGTLAVDKDITLNVPAKANMKAQFAWLSKQIPAAKK